jgi:alkane 1-monooxygenase
MAWVDLRFLLAWSLPLAVGAAAWVEPWLAWPAVFVYQVVLALLEPLWPHAPAARQDAHAGFAWCLRMHVLWQASLLALGVALAIDASAWGVVVALGIGVGGVTGSQGITFAHELGHSKARFDRLLAWLLMASVLYAHFMVEHYRGHHRRAATHADPASARYGESLWRFLPRTLAGSWTSAWALEAQQLAPRARGWIASPLAWATAAQVAGLLVLGAAFGAHALLFWLVQAAYAVFLLEAINYIEHYGLQRAEGERFEARHAWNADATITNCFIANLQRHSDHHLHAWKPYATLDACADAPQLPTGYAGCLFLASVPRLWFAAMHPRLAALRSAAA